MGILNKNEQARFDAELSIIKPQLLKARWDENQVLHRRRFAPALMAPSFTLEYCPHFPLAIIQFVGDDESLITALDHAIPWADTEDGGLDVPFVYSTNGCSFQEYNTVTHQKRFLGLPDFPSPISLWNRCTYYKGIRPALAVKLPASWDGLCRQRSPRHFEATALRRIVESILTGSRRMSLTIGAPGSSHFLAARLFAHLWRERLAKRFLFLTNWDSLLWNEILQHFGAPDQVEIDNLLLRPEVSEDNAHLVVPAAKNLEASLYEFPPDYFEVVAVDEFQRFDDVADEDLKKLLAHFCPAIQVGFSCHPLQSDQNWFGKTIYQYTIRHWEKDGFRPDLSVLLREKLDRIPSPYSSAGPLPYRSWDLARDAAPARPFPLPNTEALAGTRVFPK
ncbi:MAG: hypothetical protein KDD27_25910 [Saprospiraceae bacterium]|nr:hypothetical protein [Saprospiraceae bacterium]